jgi:transglutaminase-like putative cysteine protease
MATRELPVSVTLAALSATVALAFGAVFTSGAYVGPLVGAALLPHAIGWITRRWTRSGTRGVAIAAVALVVYTVGLLGAPGPATASQLFDRLQSGWTVIQNSTVPIPATGGTVLLAVLVMWLVATLTDTLAFRHRMSVGALAPAMMTEISVRAWSTRGWVPSTVGFGVAAVLFLALQHQVLLSQSRTPVGQSAGGYVPRLLVTAFIAGVAAVLIGAAVAPALPGGGYPIFRDIGTGLGGSYQAKTPPEVNLGDALHRGARQELFTVRASQPAYWRQTALDTYSDVSGGQWTLNASGNGAVGQNLSGPAPAGALHQTYHIGPLGERWMPAAFDPVTVSRSGTLVVRASATLVTSQPSVDGLTYTVDSRLAQVAATPAERAATAAPIPPSLRPYVALPASVPADVRATTKQLTQRLTNPYDEAAALRSFFRDGSFVYDLNTVLGDNADAMSHFLQVRHGFCVQFATTYAVMARLAGIPARVAIGFTPGTRDAKGIYHVTNYESHAWPEVWLAGLGWTDQFDPTPTSSLPGASHLPGEPPNVGASTPRSTPVPTTAPAATAPGPPGTPGSPNGGGVSSPPVSPGRGVTVTRSPTGGGVSAVGGVLLIAALVFGGLALAAAVLLARKRRRRARRRAGSDASALITGAWAEVVDELRGSGVAWPVSLTPLELASGIQARIDGGIAPPLTSLARRYTAARYGEFAPPSGSGEAAWRDADAVLRALEAGLDLRTRLRAQFATRRSDQPDPAGWSLPRRRSTKV